MWRTKFIKFENFGFPIHESSADSFGEYWLNARTGIKITPVKIKNPYPKNLIKDYVVNIIGYISNYISNIRLKNSKSKILVFLSEQEIYYHGPIISNAVEENNLDIHVVLNNVNFFKIRSFRKKFRFKVSSLIFKYFFRKDKKYFSINKNSLETNKNNYIFNSEILHFLIFQRWSKLAIYKKYIKELITRMNPELVIHSSIEDYSIQVISEAAKESSIKSISIPHGILGTTRRGISLSEKFCVGNKLARESALACGINLIKLKFFKTLILNMNTRWMNYLKKSLVLTF